MFLQTRQGFAKLCKERGFKRGAGVGVRYGYFSRFLLENTNMTVYSIDPWEDNVELKNGPEAYDRASGVLAPFGQRSVMHKAWSPQAAADYEDGFFDFIYIDGAHDFESVKADLEAWWPKLRYGGIFAGHDYDAGEWPGVVQAVDVHLAKWPRELFLTGIGDNYGETDGMRPSFWVVK